MYKGWERKAREERAADLLWRCRIITKARNATPTSVPHLISSCTLCAQNNLLRLRWHCALALVCVFQAAQLQRIRRDACWTMPDDADDPINFPVIFNKSL